MDQEAGRTLERMNFHFQTRKFSQLDERIKARINAIDKTLQQEIKVERQRYCPFCYQPAGEGTKKELIVVGDYIYCKLCSDGTCYTGLCKQCLDSGARSTPYCQLHSRLHSNRLNYK